MQRQSSLLVGLLSLALALPVTGLAVTANNPYVDSITNRNLFSLKAPPRPEDLAAKTPPPPVPNVTLAGITTLMGGKRALLRVPRPARPPEPAKEIPLILKEGDPAEEGVQVLEINIASGTVKVNNNGTVQTLDMEKNAPKAAAAPAPGAVPVPPPHPRSAIPVPVPAPAAAPVPGAGPVSIGRPLRTNIGGGGGDASGGVLGGGPSGISQPQAPAPLSMEEQVIMIEANRAANPDQAPILPPTELGDILKEEGGGGTPPPFPQ
jgi:hypothetical protein